MKSHGKAALTGPLAFSTAAILLVPGAQAAQQQMASQQQMELFRKGFTACLEPKGYTVK